MQTRTRASFIPLWDYDFLPCLHESYDASCRSMWLWCHFYWIGYRRLRMRYPFQTPRRVISFWSEQAYRVYMTSKWVFVVEWKSRSGTVTWVNAHQYDSLRYEILFWNHVNEYRSTRLNWSELEPEWKSRWYHGNTPLVQSTIYLKNRSPLQLALPLRTLNAGIVLFYIATCWGASTLGNRRVLEATVINVGISVLAYKTTKCASQGYKSLFSREITFRQ